MKTFIWCPQEFAEGCQTNLEHAHVCITSPDCREIEPLCGVSRINLRFYDLDPIAVMRTAAAKEQPDMAKKLCDGCLTDEQARSIVEFIWPLDCLVIVNCEGGVSRSPAVVLALRRHFGGDTEEPFKRAIPNIYVASVLGKVLKERPV